MHDEAEIRGHRRTYIGALPGTIIQALRKAGTSNPVMMLDEIDKLGQGFHGDPVVGAAGGARPGAEQHLPRQLPGRAVRPVSRSCSSRPPTCWRTSPARLRDRMEVIDLPGYTEEEKVEIAKRYLVRRQLTANGLTPEQAAITDDAIREIIRYYTREAGDRNLERMIGGVFRNVAMRIAEGTIEQLVIGPDEVTEILGGRAVRERDGDADQRSRRGDRAGLDAGRRRHPVHRGDADARQRAADPDRSAGRCHEGERAGGAEPGEVAAGGAGDRPGGVRQVDIHVHVPAGAIPKDGPSAGVAMFMALVSLLTGRTIRSDLAMTGEISLRGLVLPVGGIKEKVLAAQRAGITTVMLPARNRRDYEEIPEAARDALNFVWLERVDDAIAAALELTYASSSSGALRPNRNGATSRGAAQRTALAMTR